AVVLVPALVDGDLDLVVPGREGAAGEAVGSIALRILQPRAQARGIPIARTPEEALVVAGSGGDRGVAVARDPVRVVVVVELDRAVGGDGQGDVRAVGAGVRAVVLSPTVVEGGLVI